MHSKNNLGFIFKNSTHRNFKFQICLMLPSFLLF